MERCNGEALDSYSGGARFESRQEHGLSWLWWFVVFLSPSMCRDSTPIRSRPLPFESYPTHHPSSRRYSLATEHVIKQPPNKSTLCYHSRSKQILTETSTSTNLFIQHSDVWSRTLPYHSPMISSLLYVLLAWRVNTRRVAGGSPTSVTKLGEEWTTEMLIRFENCYHPFWIQNCNVWMLWRRKHLPTRGNRLSSSHL
jgi:hypothetical protein